MEEAVTKNNHKVQTVVTAIVGFTLSVFLIFIALLILVRFWVFTNVAYNLFVFSYLIVGVIFNMASINLTLEEYPQSLHILPFVLGTPITLFWSVFCIILPFYKSDFFSQFSQLPIATYDSGFYDGLGYDPKKTSIHPFARKFTSENSMFENSILLIILLVVLTVVQIIFWINTDALYYKIKREEIKLSKMERNETKEQ